MTGNLKCFKHCIRQTTHTDTHTVMGPTQEIFAEYGHMSLNVVQKKKKGGIINIIFVDRIIYFIWWT